MAIFSIILSLIISCSYLDIVYSQCDLTCENVDDDIADIVSQMDDLGYSVMSGQFELYDPETSPVYIPFARDDTDYLVSIFEDDNGHYRFGGQDAIIFRGCTPPTVKYFGYRSYSAARIITQDNFTVPIDVTILESSLGDTTNQLVINTESNDETTFPAPFDRKTNIVTTGDEQTWTDVMNAYINAGLLTENSINIDVISNGYLSKFGIGWFKYSESELDVPRDTLSIVMRIQFDEDSECNKDQYLNQSFPFRVFYKDETRPRQPIIGVNDLRDTKKKSQCRKATDDRLKYYFDKATSNVIEHVRKEYGYKLVSNKPLDDRSGKCSWLGPWFPPNNDENVHIFKHGFYCMLYQKDCMFDNRDTYYSWPGEDHTLGEDDFYMIVGLNHNNFTLSTQNSISLATVQNPDNANAFELIETVTNEDYQQYNLGDIIKCKPKSKSKSRSKSKGKKGGNDDSRDRRRRLKGSSGGGKFRHHKKPNRDKYQHCKEFEDVFAVQIARPENCAFDSTVVPSVCLDTDTLPADQPFIFFGEATLNPETFTMPDGDKDCMIHWRLLRFSTKGCTRRPSPPPTPKPTWPYSNNAGSIGSAAV